MKLNDLLKTVSAVVSQALPNHQLEGYELEGLTVRVRVAVRKGAGLDAAKLIVGGHVLHEEEAVSVLTVQLTPNRTQPMRPKALEGELAKALGSLREVIVGAQHQSYRLSELRIELGFEVGIKGDIKLFFSASGSTATQHGLELRFRRT